MIEGLDRAGKSTQVKKLCDRLYGIGHNIKTVRFPERTSPIGQMIDGYLQSAVDMEDHAIHLLFSANRWEKAKWIEDQIAKGCTIVCDRYYYSGMVYSAAKKNPALTLEWAKPPEVGLPRPDAVIFLDLDAETAAMRGGYGEEKYEKREMQERVRELFLDLEYFHGDEADMMIVNAAASVEEVHKRIMAEIKDTLESVERGDLGREIRKVNPW